MGVDPYPSASKRTHYAGAIHAAFDDLEGKVVTVAGRLVSWRPHGKVTFGHIQDQSAEIQLLLHKEDPSHTEAATESIGYDDLKLLDIGDFVEATGRVTKTRRGEISIQTNSLRLLSKSLRPLPEKWHGLKDREAILRRRYLHTTHDPSERDRFSRVSEMIQAIRVFLVDRGFLEFNTPVLQPQYGGGTAKPFTTYVNALHCKMYLSISHELYLKRLIAAGFDKVFTIGRYFRNEGIDRSHHPEFSMVETMTAYENYEYNMDLVEEMFKHVAREVFGKTIFKVSDQDVDFGGTWHRISMVDAVLSETGVDFSRFTSTDEANSALVSLGVKDKTETSGKALVTAFENFVEPKLIQPTFVYGHPMDISPLAKPMADDPRYAERFEIFIGGMECGDNWSEQNDPVSLLDTWERLRQLDPLNPDESHPIDYDFVEVLEHGLPPTTGIGPGIERMAMLFTETSNIDDVIFFPMMRPTLSVANAAVFDVKGLPSDMQHAGEDLVLSIEEFQELLEDGILSPQTSQIDIHPYIRIWKRPTSKGRYKASGYLEVDGFLLDGRIMLSGYRVKSEELLSLDEEVRGMVEAVEHGIGDVIRDQYPDCSIEISEVIQLRGE